MTTDELARQVMFPFQFTTSLPSASKASPKPRHDIGSLI
jgi:hypothetical protein